MKNIFKVVAIVAVVATAGFSTMKSNNEISLSNLQMENIEFLAQAENSALCVTWPGYSYCVETYNTAGAYYCPKGWHCIHLWFH